MSELTSVTLMKIERNKEENLIDLEKLEQNFSLKGIFNPKIESQNELNIYERMGFTTSINSIVKDLEQNEQIRIRSPFSQSQNSGRVPSLTKFGSIPIQDLNKITLNPTIRRIKFINGFLLSFLLVALVISFIISYIL